MAPTTIRRILPAALTIALALIGSSAGAAPIGIAASGSNGESTPPPGPPTGQPCMPEDATTFVASDALAPGELAAPPGSLGLSLGILPDGGSAFLLPDQSFVSLSNQRGTIRLQLTSGSCGSPTLSYDGSSASGSATWSVDPAGTAGSYREATGSGTGTFTAGLTPGTTNPWSLNLNGAIEVLQPSVTASLLESTWAHQPKHTSGKVATVTYLVTNEGPGDAFGSMLLDAQAPGGVVPVDFQPAALGDLAAGETTEVVIRWEIPKPNHGPRPKAFDSTLTIQQADALDVASTGDQVVHVDVPHKDH